MPASRSWLKLTGQTGGVREWRRFEPHLRRAGSFLRPLLFAESASRVWILISLCIALLMAAFCLAIGEALS